MLILSPCFKSSTFLYPKGVFTKVPSATQGLVDSISPNAGVGFEPDALILSMKTNPGSPVSQAHFTIKSKISFAFSLAIISFECGSTNSISPSCSTLFIKFSSKATEILKFSNCPCGFLNSINSLIFGW